MKNKVILDTSFLLVPYKFHIDIFFEVSYLVGNVEFVLSRGIMNELKSLSNKKGRTALEARFATKMLERNTRSIKVVSSVEPVDRWIVNYAKKYNAIACTNDMKLKNILKREKVKTIMVKSRSKIDFV